MKAKIIIECINGAYFTKFQKGFLKNISKKDRKGLILHFKSMLDLIKEDKGGK